MELIRRVGAVLVALLTLPLIIGQMEHKVMAHAGQFVLTAAVRVALN